LYGNFQGKFPENPEIVEFPKSEPSNRKFRKFREENQMEGKFPVINFRKFARLSSFPEIPENAVPFATRNFAKCKPEFLVEWKAPLVHYNNSHSARILSTPKRMFHNSSSFRLFVARTISTKWAALVLELQLVS